MRLCDAQDVVALVTAKALDKSKLQRVEPELGRAVVALDVDVWRLESVGHVKEEAIAALAENGWHGGSVSVRAGMTRCAQRRQKWPTRAASANGRVAVP